jgi:hypothetical protein
MVSRPLLSSGKKNLPSYVLVLSLSIRVEWLVELRLRLNDDFKPISFIPNDDGLLIAFSSFHTNDPQSAPNPSF